MTALEVLYTVESITDKHEARAACLRQQNFLCCVCTAQSLGLCCFQRWLYWTFY